MSVLICFHSGSNGLTNRIATPEPSDETFASRGHAIRVHGLLTRCNVTDVVSKSPQTIIVICTQLGKPYAANRDLLLAASSAAAARRFLPLGCGQEGSGVRVSMWSTVGRPAQQAQLRVIRTPSFSDELHATLIDLSKNNHLLGTYNAVHLVNGMFPRQSCLRREEAWARVPMGFDAHSDADGRTPSSRCASTPAAGDWRGSSAARRRWHAGPLLRDSNPGPRCAATSLPCVLLRHPIPCRLNANIQLVGNKDMRPAVLRMPDGRRH